VGDLVSAQEGFQAVLAVLMDVKDAISENTQSIQRLETALVEHVRTEEDWQERIGALISQYGSRIRKLESPRNVTE
jgi:hypothetical protein